jgi:chorismate dehydratase
MKLKTAIVSYHNTVPFLEAIQHSDLGNQLELFLTPPSQCANLFANGSVDLALVPVGSLQDLTDYKIIADTCIGCNGSVYTVAIFSNTPLHLCKGIYLDADSRTSNDLAQIITNEYMQIDLEVSGFTQFPFQFNDEDAYILIGDKVFEHEHKFSYKFDLGTLWKEYVGLPFAFAVWIVRNNVDLELEYEVCKVLNNLNLNQIEDEKIGPNMTLLTYLNDFISFDFDENKKLALSKYLLLQKKLKVGSEVEF